MRLITSFPFCVSNKTLVLLTELPSYELSKRVGEAINEAYQKGLEQGMANANISELTESPSPNPEG